MMGKPAAGTKRSEYRVPSKCRVCGKSFMARYNVADRARVCTPPTHKCRPGTKNGKKTMCLDACCRSKYRRGVAAAVGSAIDSRKFLNDAEFKKFTAEAARLKDPKGIAVRFIVETGCRLGESLLVRKEHLEFKAGDLSVIRIPTLKKAGHPEMPVYVMNGAFTKDLQKWSEKLGPSDALFDVGRRTLQRVFERILDGIKPDRASLVHLLRHTRASRLSASGLDPNTIREQMRWASIELLKVYSHTTEEKVAKALKRM
jgi:integrase